MVSKAERSQEKGEKRKKSTAMPKCMQGRVGSDSPISSQISVNVHSEELLLFHSHLSAPLCVAFLCFSIYMTHGWGYPVWHHPWEFPEKLQPQQNTAVKAIWGFAAWAIWWAVTDGHFRHSARQQLEGFLVYFCIYLSIWFLTATESILPSRAAGGLHTLCLGLMCHSCATFPVKTSAVPCPSQARTASGF